MMTAIRFALLFATLNVIAPVAGPLRVMRVSPESPADPLTEITVTFDRPVAGGLEGSVPAVTIFRLSPQPAGETEWRDPLTIRFTPASPLTPGQTYTITVDTGFKAMDGATLERAFTYVFTVSPPRLLAADPVTRGALAANLPALPTFRILMSAPVDADAYAAGSSVRMDRRCGSTVIPLLVTAQHPIGPDDPQQFRWAGVRRQPRDSASDLRRVVELRPASPLPLDCPGIFRVPTESGGDAVAPTNWSFHTYGPFRTDSVACAFQGDAACPTGPLNLRFSTPVRGADLLRAVRLLPTREFTVRDTTAVLTQWVLDAKLEPRTNYAVVIDRSLEDVFGQPLGGRTVLPFRTTGYAPTVSYEYGRMLVEKDGLQTLPVQHVNVDTLYVHTVVVPDSMERQFLGREWGWEEVWATLAGTATTRKVAVRHGSDERLVTGVRLTPSQPRPGASLLAIQVTASALDSMSRRNRPIALVQVTNLAIHARIAVDRGRVWVTGVNDGLPRQNVHVDVRDTRGSVRGSGITDVDGVATIDNFTPDSGQPDECCWGFEGYVVASTADDRALVGISTYDPDLAPWRFGVWGAWERTREPAAAAVFAERGIYRPGETVYAKAIVREGPLGSLTSPAGDSLRWVFHDRERNALRDTAVVLSEFGTADAVLALPADAPLGSYSIEIRAKLRGEWNTVDQTFYTVAEYRPPEFLVDASAHEKSINAGDTATVTIGGRYLFGAPMAHSPVTWNVRVSPASWGAAIPGAEGFTVGASWNWWESGSDTGARVVSQGVDTLDASGMLDLRIGAPASGDGRPANATVVATVTDANRQTVAAAATMTVHPASLYVGARTTGDRWFWTTGQPVTVEVIAIRPSGERVSGVDIDGTVIRREWHRTRRVRNGQVEQVGGWVTDTVATCTVRSREAPAPCTFTPTGGGSYTVSFATRDEAGRPARTSLNRWAAGEDWVPWNDDSQLKMDVITDRPTYDVGDTATVFFASPFTDAEAWITIEREHVLESRRIRLTSGATTLRLPITEAHSPNVYVSIVVVRGRSAEPGPLDDPGRPTLRVGYAQLRVLPAVKRLEVTVTPQGRKDSGDEAAATVEYEPGDTAAVRVRVTDANGAGRRTEVTLWAVDEGVLSLTGYTLPDPVSLIYRERGVGVRLASNLAGVAPQIPDGQKGQREAGGGGGSELAGILRSQFRTTAFFLGSVITDSNGDAVVNAKLPDNLTTFRVMAVAVTSGDRYGSGQSTFLVTRPLIARPALPRFVRPGDRFEAGVVVNSRMGGTPEVEVEAIVTGIDIDGGKKKKQRLSPGRGGDFRFEFRAQPGDSASFVFDARGQDNRDAVRLAVPVRPDFHPLATTIAGVVRDSATARFILRDDVDPKRSTLGISFGSSVFAVIEGARQNLRVYPYYCSEQLTSLALPIVALYQARLQLGMDVEASELQTELRNAVRLLTRRQTSSGGIGYWSASDWSSPRLSAYAGRVLLSARDAGMSVDSAALDRLADYLRRSLRNEDYTQSPIAWYYTDIGRRLGERVAAVEFLSLYGKPDVATENTLLQQVSRLLWEDRLALAEMLARRGEAVTANALLEQAWTGVRYEGRRAVLPDSAGRTHYFRSTQRGAGRLLAATLAIRPDHPGTGALVETLVEQGRSEARRPWTTQDYGWTVLALSDYERLRMQSGDATVRIRGNRGQILSADVGRSNGLRVTADTMFPLDRLVTKDESGRNILNLDLTSGSAGRTGTSSQSPTVPVFYFLTVRETPVTRPVDPVDQGITVERWYETIDTKQPVTSVAEGGLVRVRLRVTVPGERHFVVLDDPLPAGLEPVDLSLRTVAPPGATFPEYRTEYDQPDDGAWYYGSWDSGIWSPFDHRELRDDRVVYSATMLWNGAYMATYIARATTAGTFVVPPAHAEEMYNPGVNGRTGGTTFTVTRVKR